ncbi:MAG: hypothetical protein GX638_10760 [Crenarchaeota archaeon]|mgnify:CR=1 FL=1|nr:hypothetical protein [Thermoproteota archaeon]
MSRLKDLIICLQGVALACWFFDVSTTYFALKILGCVELNPLGWPLGILGAAVYYIPTIIGTFYLLFKINTKVSYLVAMFITVITLFMASLNFNAALSNFGNVVFFGGLQLNVELMNICVIVGSLLALYNAGPVLIKHLQFGLGRIFLLERGPRSD